MKQVVYTFILLAAMCFASCQKDSVIPQTSTSQTGINKTVSSTTATQTTPAPAVDTTKGYLRIQLAKDAVNTDNILIDFNPTAKNSYSPSEDAVTFQGYGQVSLSSLTSDNRACAINTVPLTVKGTSVNLAVHAKTDGVYNLNMLTISGIPANYDIWLKDSYMKDSLDFRHNSTYAFNLKLADTTTYGSKRFSIVLRRN